MPLIPSAQAERIPLQTTTMQSDFPDDEERPFRDSEQSSGTLAFSPQSDEQGAARSRLWARSVD